VRAVALYHQLQIIQTANNMATTKWTIDTTHSEVQFKVKHLV